MDISWDELGAEETTAQVAEILQGECDGVVLEALAEALNDVLSGWKDDDSLRARLDAAQLILEILRREQHLSDETGEELTAHEIVLEHIDEDAFGPFTEEALSLLLGTLRYPCNYFSAQDVLHTVPMAPTPALADQAAALAEHVEGSDDVRELRLFAACGSPAHVPALVAFLSEHGDEISWSESAVVSALVELGEHAAPFLPQIGERIRGGMFNCEALLPVGEALLPYLRGSKDDSVRELVALIESPWEDLAEVVLQVGQTVSRAPSLWPDLVTLLVEEPDILPAEAGFAYEILRAAAYSRCEVGPLMPRLVELAVGEEEWMLLLAFGVRALPAVEALLQGGTLGDEAQGWLGQVRALMG